MSDIESSIVSQLTQIPAVKDKLSGVVIQTLLSNEAVNKHLWFFGLSLFTIIAILLGVSIVRWYVSYEIVSTEENILNRKHMYWKLILFFGILSYFYLTRQNSENDALWNFLFVGFYLLILAYELYIAFDTKKALDDYNSRGISEGQKYMQPMSKPYGEIRFDTPVDGNVATSEWVLDQPNHYFMNTSMYPNQSGVQGLYQ